MSSRAFDLNIEEVLENWEVEHALREVIANAFDEQFFSGTPEITITKDHAAIGTFVILAEVSESSTSPSTKTMRN